MAQFTTTYNELKTLLIEYVEDESSELDNMIKGAINRAEERLYRDLDLVIWNTATVGTTSNNNGNITKPNSDTHIHTIIMGPSGDYVQRRSMDFVFMLAPNRSTGTGQPIYYHEDQSKIYWAPVPDDAYAYTIIYSIRPTPLNPSSNTTNWFTQNVADALLYASLVECESFLVAPERVQEFEGKYQQQLGPIRGIWRHVSQKAYEPMDPTPKPLTTR